jgi:hypothetical protein
MVGALISLPETFPLPLPITVARLPIQSFILQIYSFRPIAGSLPNKRQYDHATIIDWEKVSWYPEYWEYTAASVSLWDLDDTFDA